MDTPLLPASGVTTPVGGSSRQSPTLADFRRVSSWGGRLMSPAAGGGGGDDDFAQAAARKPGAAVRETRARRTQWTVINAAGVKSTLLSDKRGIISRFKLGVPIRDMRLMDGGLFAPDAAVILVRDNAIVMRIEHVRLIATASEVLISQDGASGDAAGARFGAALLEAILDAAADGRAQTAREGESEATMMGAAPAHEPDPLPFELHVLETALRDVTASSALAVKELDAVATPALDALTRSVTTLNLERVRKIKTRHQRLLTRVQSLREELQGFLDDDADMFRMCLTRRAEAERGGPALRADLPPLATPGAGADFVGSLRSSGFTRRSSLNMGGGRLTPGPGVGTADGGPDDDTAASADADALETVENLLESYFMQVDASYDRMISMDEYIKDTEEYINIELDSSRNRLIRLEIVVTAGTFALGIWSLVAGILGENLVIPPAATKSVTGFVAINGAALMLAMSAFGGIIGYIKYMRLI